ncbi:ATP-binding protein [Kitasatospora sp. NPDC001175]|uniref:hypothetical protein n=1 Tax=Kitasatospora sp. NPDC001175 TaxID=3157103 RepID=UPI003D05B08F
MLMVEALADRWGCDRTEDGEVVWAELALSVPLDAAVVESRSRQGAARADYVLAARMGAAPARERR